MAMHSRLMRRPPVRFDGATGTDSHLVISPASASASCMLEFVNDGRLRIENFRQADQELGRWLHFGNAADYEARCTVQSGTLTTGTINTWQTCASTVTWSVGASRASVGSTNNTCTILIEVRRATTGPVMGSATFTLNATAEVN